MKQFSITLLIIIFLLNSLFIGCNKETMNNEYTTQIPNPIKKVKDTSVFKEKLGINIINTFIPDDSEYSIIDNDLANISFTTINPNNEEVKCTFRATKKKEISSSMDGIFANDKQTTTSTYNEGKEPFTLTSQYSESLTCHIYTFNINEIYYSFTVQGKISQMLLTELLDNMIAAVNS